MKSPYVILLASLAAAVPVYLINSALGLIYLMLWLDKIILRTVTPSIAGIELVSISTILLGIKFGLGGAVLAFVFMPVLEGIRVLIVPTQSDVPPFVPSPYHLGDAAVAAVAALLAQLPLLQIVPIAMPIKFLIDALIDLYIVGKPFDFLSAGASFAFNIVLVIYASGFLNMIINML